MKNARNTLKQEGQNAFARTRDKLVGRVVDLLLSIDDEDSLVAVTSEILEGQCQDATRLEERHYSRNADKALETA